MKHVKVRHGHATISIDHDGYVPQDVFVDANSSDDVPIDTGKIKRVLHGIWGVIKKIAMAML